LGCLILLLPHTDVRVRLECLALVSLELSFL
jgi:hypothetical protein